MTVTRSGIVLMHGPNAKREPGRVHDELHAPCGCAFHERPAPHWHPCQAHLATQAEPPRCKCQHGKLPQAVNEQEIEGFLQHLNAGDLHAYQHLIWQRCWWLFDVAAKDGNRVGAQSAINDLSHYAERLKAAPQAAEQGEQPASPSAPDSRDGKDLFRDRSAGESNGVCGPHGVRASGDSSTALRAAEDGAALGEALPPYVEKCERETGCCVMVHDKERPPCTPENCHYAAAMMGLEEK